MRYKAVPLSVRATPRVARPGPRRRVPPHQSPLRDWLLTVPIVFLVPLMMIPFIVLAGGPQISITQGTVQAGGSITVVGSGFDRREYVELRWDGAVVPWLPVTKSGRDGSLTVVGVLPPTVAAAQHQIEARMKQNGRDSKVHEEVVAQLTVVVGAPLTAPVATVVPRPAATAAPTAAVTATPMPSATAAPTKSPSSGTPAPTATSMPSTAPTTVASPSPTATRPPAAPELGSIMGHGARTIGGSGGRTLIVSNLNDSGPGSLRAALDATGPRIVTFSVGGLISLASDLKIDDPNVTVAGETAPQPVVIRGAGTIVRTHEVIIRNLRFRPGDAVAAPSDVDALTLNGLRSPVYNVVIDHVSMVWGPDIGGLAVLGDVRAATISNSIMGEGLYLSRHPEATAAEGGHSHAANITQMDSGSPWPRYITFARNLFTTSDTRIPRLQGAECVDLVNNVIYNWGIHAAHGNPRSVNLVNNWYRSGPESATTEVWDTQTSAVAPSVFSSSVYMAGNRADGFTATRGGGASVYSSSVRCGGLSVAPLTADVAYETVLAGAGAIGPSRDAVDGRIIGNVMSRSGSFINGVGFAPPSPSWR